MPCGLIETIDGAHRMIQVALAATLVGITVPSDPQAVTPVAIVDDTKELRRGLKANGVKFDDVFVAEATDGEAARHALRPYLEAVIARERDRVRRTSLAEILAGLATYDWHCGGFVRRARRSLFCVFDHGIITRSPGRFFPEIADGGIGVCRCVFRLRDRQIESLAWNGDP
jgi:hypothetical protein